MDTLTRFPNDRRQAVVPSGTYQSPWVDDDVRIFRKTAYQFIEKEFTPNYARWCAQHYPDARACGASMTLMRGHGAGRAKPACYYLIFQRHMVAAAAHLHT